MPRVDKFSGKPLCRPNKKLGEGCRKCHSADHGSVHRLARRLTAVFFALAPAAWETTQPITSNKWLLVLLLCMACCAPRAHIADCTWNFLDTKWQPSVPPATPAWQRLAAFHAAFQPVMAHSFAAASWTGTAVRASNEHITDTQLWWRGLLPGSRLARPKACTPTWFAPRAVLWFIGHTECRHHGSAWQQGRECTAHRSGLAATISTQQSQAKAPAPTCMAPNAPLPLATAAKPPVCPASKAGGGWRPQAAQAPGWIGLVTSACAGALVPAAFIMRLVLPRRLLAQVLVSRRLRPAAYWRQGLQHYWLEAMLAAVAALAGMVFLSCLGALARVAAAHTARGSLTLAASLESGATSGWPSLLICLLTCCAWLLQLIHVASHAATWLPAAGAAAAWLAAAVALAQPVVELLLALCIRSLTLPLYIRPGARAAACIVNGLLRIYQAAAHLSKPMWVLLHGIRCSLVPLICINNNGTPANSQTAAPNRISRLRHWFAGVMLAGMTLLLLARPPESNCAMPLPVGVRIDNQQWPFAGWVSGPATSYATQFICVCQRHVINPPLCCEGAA